MLVKKPGISHGYMLKAGIRKWHTVLPSHTMDAPMLPAVMSETNELNSCPGIDVLSKSCYGFSKRFEKVGERTCLNRKSLSWKRRTWMKNRSFVHTRPKVWLWRLEK